MGGCRAVHCALKVEIMNVRVLLTIAACFSASGCCMPGFLCNPGLMYCPPGGGFGGAPMASPYAAGPPTYRSFHNNLVSLRAQSSPIGQGNLTAYQPPIQPVRNVVRQNFRQRVAMVQPVARPVYQQYPPQQTVAVAPMLYAPTHQYAQPRRAAKPWKFPWFSRRTVRDAPLDQSTYHWLPVVNNDCNSVSPCGIAGCTSCSGTSPCSADGCGESVAALPMAPAINRKLTPVPAPPANSNERYFSAPVEGVRAPEINTRNADQRKQGVRRSTAEPLPEPPADQPNSASTPEMAEPSPSGGDPSPASKPVMADPINPFDDIEDSEPESSLPVEAEMPQATLWIPSNSSQPLMIPREQPANVAAHATRTANSIQQTSHQQSEWQAISLDRGFFQEDAAAHGVRQALVDGAQEFVPVRRVVTRRRQ